MEAETETKKQKLFMSIFSGEIYSIPEDEIANLDEGQVPLTQKPKENCRKCYGRGWIDKNIKNGIYSICRCMKTRIDFSALEKKKNDNLKNKNITIENVGNF